MASAPAAVTTGERIRAGLATLALLALLLVAASRTPDPSGLGTHQQLGLPPCSFKAVFGTPCPTCGMTTAFAHAADGDLRASAAAQPMGFLLAILSSTALWLCLHVAATGSTLGRLAGRILSPRLLWLGMAGLAAAWVYKMTSVP